jgi:hypothetical protein
MPSETVDIRFQPFSPQWIKMNRIFRFFQWRAVPAIFLIALCIALLVPVISFGDTDTAVSANIPWSGYWWPGTWGGLGTGLGYNGHPAPLEKYDLFTTGRYPGNATSYYLANDYNPDSPVTWYGLCFAWASASVYEHIDFYPSSVDNIIFNVGDKKGLITACHESDQCSYGDPNDPSVFHWWLLHYIKDQGTAFFADLDASEQVWNFPIYRYEMQSADNGSSIDVTCKIWYASDFVDPDYMGTQPETKTYTYTLYVTSGAITGGEWTGSSISDHPQKLVLPVGLGTYNPYLDYALVRKIALSKDDPLESDQPVELMPGEYNLILLNEDNFLLSTLPGESIFLGLTQLDNLSEKLNFKVKDKDGNIVQSALVGTTQQKFSWVSENPPYLVTVSRSDYGPNGGSYRLDCDLKKTYQFVNLNMQKGFGWGGVAITNPGDTRCDTVYVTGYKNDGEPIETYVGPFSLAPGQKKIVQVSDFRIREIDRNAFYGIKVHASQPLSTISLTGNYETNMSAMGQGEKSGLLIIPDSQEGYSAVRSIQWGLLNSSVSDAKADLSLYGNDGTLEDTATLSLSPDEARQVGAGFTPFNSITDGGWISVTPEDGADISGYVQWLAKDLRWAETLPLLAPASDFVIPHLAESADWAMKLILINPNDQECTARLNLLNGAVIDTRVISMKPFEKKTISMGQAYSDVDTAKLNQCGMSIQGSLPLAGYYAFDTGKDQIFFKLLNSQDAKKDFTIPHVAAMGAWWTGVNLFNPSEGQDAVINLVPYDINGNQMIDEIKQITLKPLTKAVFTAAGKWGEVANQISDIRIVVTQGPGIVGVYAYGRADFSMLAGSALQ